MIPLNAGPEPVAPDSPEEEVLRRDRSVELHRALERLPEADRQLLIRRYFLEESIIDLAAELGLTRTAIDNRLSRARQLLRAQLTERKGVQGVV